MWNQSKRRNPKSRNRYQPPRVAESASSTTESKSSCTDEGACHEETVEDVAISNQDLNGAPDESDVSPLSDDQTAEASCNSNDVQVPHSSSSEMGETKHVDLPLKMSETVLAESLKQEQKENLIFNVQDDSYNMQGSVDSVKVHVASSIKEINNEVSESESHSEASNMIKTPQDSSITVNEMVFSSELLKQENERDLSIQKPEDVSSIEIKDLVSTNSNSVKDSQPILVELQQLSIYAADENVQDLTLKGTSKISDFSFKNVETSIKDTECLQSKPDSNISNLENKANINGDPEVEVNGKFSPFKPTLLIETTSEQEKIEIKNTVKKIIASLGNGTDIENGENQITDQAPSCDDHKDLDSSKTEPKRLMMEGPESEKTVPTKRFKTGYFTETAGANVDQSADSSALLEDKSDDSEMPDLVPVESEPSFTPIIENGRVFDVLDWERHSVDINPRLLAASMEDLNRVIIFLGENVTSSTQNLFNNGPVLRETNDSVTSSDTESSDTSDELKSDVAMQATEESANNENEQNQSSVSNRRIIPVQRGSYYDRNAQFSSSEGDSVDEENLEYEIDISRLEYPLQGVMATVRPRSVRNQERLNTKMVLMDLITAIFSYCFYIFLAAFVICVTWVRNKFRF